MRSNLKFLLTVNTYCVQDFNQSQHSMQMRCCMTFIEGHREVQFQFSLVNSKFIQKFSLSVWKTLIVTIFKTKANRNNSSLKEYEKKYIYTKKKKKKRNNSFFTPPLEKCVCSIFGVSLSHVSSWVILRQFKWIWP